MNKRDFFAEPTVAQTRGHTLKVAKPQAHSRVRRNHFSTRVMNDWNALPEAIMSAPTVNTFKNRLDKNWLATTYVTSM